MGRHGQEGAEVRHLHGGDHGEAPALRGQDGRGREGLQGQGGGRERPEPSGSSSRGGVSHLGGEACHDRDEAGAHVQGRGQHREVCRHWESKTMNNEVEIEEIDKNLREARRIAEDNEMKYDNLARSLAMMEDELKRADERVKNAEARVVVIEDELAAIGENQKALEVSEEKARLRE